MSTILLFQRRESPLQACVHKTFHYTIPHTKTLRLSFALAVTCQSRPAFSSPTVGIVGILFERSMGTCSKGWHRWELVRKTSNVGGGEPGHAIPVRVLADKWRRKHWRLPCADHLPGFGFRGWLSENNQIASHETSVPLPKDPAPSLISGWGAARPKAARDGERVSSLHSRDG